MSKYPTVLLFRYPKYKDIDIQLENNKDKLNCTVQIVDSKEDLLKLFDVNYAILATFGSDEKEYHADVFSVIAPRMAKRWLHYKDIPDFGEFSRGVNYCFINNVISDRTTTRPIFSIFTTCYKSYEKIQRPLTSLMNQTLLDWEWIVLDDSPDDEHFKYLKKLFRNNRKIRLYKRAENSGNIGNVKNEAIALCRGTYILELDHDDEIVPSLLKTAVDAFQKYPDAGFAYTDFINIYESGANYRYGDFFGLGYAGYYMMKYNGKWVYVYTTPQVNNITLSHLVSMPNHARIWKRSVLMELGSYSEFLPINDDQEILMRTAMDTKMVKIPIMGYVQYMNESNNNFSLIRNSEINRIGPNFLVPQYYNKYRVHQHMKEIGAYDDENYFYNRKQVWLRDDFSPRYANYMYQPEFQCQVCILGLKAFEENLEKLKVLYEDKANNLFLIDDCGDIEKLCSILDDNGMDRARCYTIKDLTREQMLKYFQYIVKTAEKVVMIE